MLRVKQSVILTCVYVYYSFELIFSRLTMLNLFYPHSSITIDTRYKECEIYVYLGYM